MTSKEYSALSQGLVNKASQIENAKRPEYTNNDLDVLRNFKQCGVEAGCTSEQAWIIYAKKHWDAIRTQMMNENQTASEPIEGRFADLINYLKLGYALWVERENRKVTNVATSVWNPNAQIKVERAYFDQPAATQKSGTVYDPRNDSYKDSK